MRRLLNNKSLVALFIIGASLMMTLNVYAIYGVDNGEGYFDGHDMCVDRDGDSDGDGVQDCMEGSVSSSDFYVLPVKSGGKALPNSIDNAGELYDLLVEYNDSDSDKKKTGSGFIVNTMLGRDSGDDEGRRIDDSTWKDLKARLRSMDSKDQIDWDGNYSYCKSSFYTKYYYNRDGDEKKNNDVAFYDLKRGSCKSDPSIRFYDDNGDLIYALSRVCANPVGSDLGELPEANDWKVSVKSEIINRSSLPLTVGSTVSWKHTVKNDGPDETDVDVDYRYEDGGVLGSGSGENHEFSEGADDKHSEDFNSTSRAITQDDVGGQMCRATSAQSKSWDSSDRIYSSNACVTIPYNYSLLPSVSTNVSGGIVEADMPISIFPTVSNEIKTNPTKSKNTQWRVTEIIFDTDTDVPASLLDSSTYSDSEPCPNGIYFNPNMGCRNVTTIADKTGNTVFTENGDWRSGDILSTNVVVGSYDVGTKVCYAFSIQPNKSTPSVDDNRWRHSALDCFIVGKKPKVQIWGGDLKTGGSVQTSTSRKSIGGVYGTFGSWAEYGIISALTINGMASGSAFNSARGLASTNVCDYSYISFINSTGASCRDSSPIVIGNYSNTQSMPDVASNFTATGESIGVDAVIANDLRPDQGVYIGSRSGNLTLNQSQISAGKTIVLKVTGTVVIAGNQTYDNDNFGARYKSISDIPQLVIIAGNIVIEDDVTNIDAWLVAPDGYINTCASVGMVDVRLSSLICNQKLTVNGPVMTGKLYLNRTAGSNAGVRSGDPAEVFNLRPDAYLWAYSTSRSNGQIHTVKTTELPPRL